MTPIESARKVAYNLRKQNTSARIGLPVRTIKVKETISQKARRVWTECERITGGK